MLAIGTDPPHFLVLAIPHIDIDVRSTDEVLHVVFFQVV